MILKLFHETGNADKVLKSRFIACPFAQPWSDQENPEIKQYMKRRVENYMELRKKIFESADPEASYTLMSAQTKEIERTCFVWFTTNKAVARQRAAGDLAAVLELELPSEWVIPRLPNETYIVKTGIPHNMQGVVLAPHYVRLDSTLRRVHYLHKKARAAMRKLADAYDLVGVVQLEE